jgi:hypothetical protein
MTYKKTLVANKTSAEDIKLNATARAIASES